MRYVITLFVFLGIIVGIFWMLGEHQKKNPPPPPPSAPRPPAPAWTESIMAMQPAATPTPVPVQQQAPAQAPRPAVAPSRRGTVEAAARQAGVRIISYNEVGSNITVRIEWISSNAAQGGDFLDAMIRSGMRDFDDLGKGQLMRGGQRVFWGSYRLKM